MSQITFKGEPVNTVGDLPEEGSRTEGFTLVGKDLSDVSLVNFHGQNVVLNVFPSLDTAVCAASVRKFNERAAGLGNTVVFCISMDLPFAMNRFCTAEGIENVVTLSAFRSPSFGKDFGVVIEDSPLKGLFARAVIVLDEAGRVVYRELVPEITNEPDYDKALAVLG